MWKVVESMWQVVESIWNDVESMWNDVESMGECMESMIEYMESIGECMDSIVEYMESIAEYMEQKHSTWNPPGMWGQGKVLTFLRPSDTNPPNKHVFLLPISQSKPIFSKELVWVDNKLAVDIKGCSMMQCAIFLLLLSMQEKTAFI